MEARVYEAVEAAAPMVGSAGGRAVGVETSVAEGAEVAAVAAGVALPACRGVGVAAFSLLVRDQFILHILAFVLRCHCESLAVQKWREGLGVGVRPASSCSVTLCTKSGGEGTVAGRTGFLRTIL